MARVCSHPSLSLLCPDLRYRMSPSAMVVLALAGAGALLAFAGRKRIQHLVERYWNWGKFRIVFNNLQIVRSIPSTCGVGFPEPANAFISALDLAALNPFDIISAECTFNALASYDTRVTAATLGVACLCLLNWVVWLVRRAVGPNVTRYQSKIFAQVR